MVNPTRQEQLSEVWDALDTPIYRVLDEDGAWIVGALVRPAGDHEWLYVDDSNGYDMITASDVRRLSIEIW